MNQFSIKDIENLCGIKAHTLRTWEQRYQLCIPDRKDSQHRTYTGDDLKELLRISFLYHSGYKISRIAGLQPAEIGELVEKHSQCRDNTANAIYQLIEAGMDFDKEKFEQIVTQVVASIGMERAICEVFYPFLQRVGMLWLTDHVIPAQEHFISHILRKKIIVATDKLANTSPSAPVLVFAPPGEFHEIPLLTANYLFRKYGNRTVYFGTNVSIKALEEYLHSHPCRSLYAHVITKLRCEVLNEFIRGLSSQFPGIPIVISGPAIACIEHKQDNIRMLHSLEEMISFAKETATAT